MMVYVDDNTITNARTMPLARALILKTIFPGAPLSALSAGRTAGVAADTLLDFLPTDPIWRTMRRIVFRHHLKVRMSFASVWSSLREALLIPERDPLDYPFVESDVARLQGLAADPSRHVTDDATWRDLMLSQYCAELSGEVSIFGQHVLYRRLREGGGEAVAPSVRALLDDPEQVAALHLACRPLRQADKEIATLLYQEAAPLPPRWLRKTWIVPILLVASAAAAMLLSPLAWLVTFALLFFLMSNQVRYGYRVEEWQRSMKSLQLLLRVASQRGGADAGDAARLNRALTRSPASALIPGLQSYQDWFALKNITHYFDSARLVHASLPLLRRVMLAVGTLEADVALARHLLQVPVFCWSARSAARELALQDTVHPLLPAAQPLTFGLDQQGAFVSGQNGIGKSTLLRTVGLNLVAARAFGFCYARQARVPDLPVYSSMQNEDSLLGAESLYIAELRRAKELLAAADGSHPGICVIDEIFRGTNHLESVSAAAAVLDLLAQRGLVLVSSHNLVLASLLKHRLTPLCVARDSAGALVLAPGVLAHTNGIALLAERGFTPQVASSAGKVFDWLSGYLAHPADSTGVLA
jgi:hypothetical protein